MKPALSCWLALVLATSCIATLSAQSAADEEDQVFEPPAEDVQVPETTEAKPA